MMCMRIMLHCTIHSSILINRFNPLSLEDANKNPSHLQPLGVIHTPALECQVFSAGKPIEQPWQHSKPGRWQSEGVLGRPAIGVLVRSSGMDVYTGCLFLQHISIDLNAQSHIMECRPALGPNWYRQWTLLVATLPYHIFTFLHGAGPLILLKCRFTRSMVQCVDAL